MVGTNIAEKLAQLKNQIATLEKREERYAAYYFSSRICDTFCLFYDIILCSKQIQGGVCGEDLGLPESLLLPFRLQGNDNVTQTI